MKIILLGAPNSGKGTLARNIENKYNLVEISTGDLLRKEVATGSELGKHINEVQMGGGLVEFETVVAVMKNYINSLPKDANLLFDGFPRTIEQAEALKDIAKIDAVLMLDVSPEEVLSRALGRITCEKCNQIYNRSWYKADKCEKCGGNLMVRADDNEESVRKRIDTYFKQTYPLVEYYSKQNLIHKLDASKTPEYTLQQAEKILEQIK